MTDSLTYPAGVVPTSGIREQADSAAGQPAADSLHADTLATESSPAFPYAVFGTADSLRVLTPETSPYRDVPAQAVFGAQSATVQPLPLQAAAPVSLTDNAVFQGFVLLLAATYALLLYHNLSDVMLLLGRITRDAATGKRLSEDPGSSGFSRFLNTVTVIGMLFMGVVVVKYGDSLIPGNQSSLLPQGAVLALSLVAAFACAGVGLFQLAAVRAVGAVTLSQPFISQLVLLKRTYFSLGVIVTSPALLLFALCPRGTGGVWFSIVAVALTVTAILYIKEALNLFLSKKISILHWFLYLCIVEIFPISLLWLLAVR